jgi:hypothetical protein
MMRPRNKWVFAVGLLFSALIIIENVPQFFNTRFYLIGLGTAPTRTSELISAAIVLVPLAILWIGYFCFTRLQSRRLRLSFTLFATALFVAMEILMNTSFAWFTVHKGLGPIAQAYFTFKERFDIDRAVISDVSDEPVLTKQGNQIGVRIRFAFPQSDNRSMRLGGPWVTTAPNPDPYEWKDWIEETSFRTSPVRWQMDDRGAYFAQWRTDDRGAYFDFYPRFIFRSSKGNLCLEESGAEMLARYPAGMQTYHIRFELEAAHASEASMRMYPTKQKYDVSEFHRTAVKENLPICDYAKIMQGLD